MIQYLARRILITLPVIFGVMVITFFLVHFVPGDPIDIMLGDQASPLDKAALRAQLGLDKSVPDQFVSFFSHLVRGDLGQSLQSKRPVLEELLERIPATVELTLAAMLIAISIGIPLGTLAAVWRNTWLDRSIMFWSLFGMSTPGFWLGPMLIWIFALKLDWFPVSERGGLENLVLPALTLANGLSSILMQVTRASMMEVIQEDFIRVARAKGLHPLKIYFKHALGNALMPVITILGLQFGALLTGTVIIETIFDWPGVGTLLYQSITQRNYPLVQGCVLLISITYVAVNLLTDLAYAYANPRVRLS